MVLFRKRSKSEWEMSFKYRLDKYQITLLTLLCVFWYIISKSPNLKEIIDGGALSTSINILNIGNNFDITLILPKLFIHQSASHFWGNFLALMSFTIIFNMIGADYRLYWKSLGATAILELLVIIIKYLTYSEGQLEISPIGMSSFVYALLTICTVHLYRTFSQQYLLTKLIITPLVYVFFLYLIFEFVLGVFGGSMSSGHLCGTASGLFLINRLQHKA